MKMMRLKHVMENTGLSRSMIYKLIAAGDFPKPVPLWGRAVAWIDEEVEAWILGRIEERDTIDDTSHAK